MAVEASTDGRIQRGNETRRAVLSRAMDVASVEGLGALSVGRLASDLGLSKSGVFAVFGSKAELQLATIRAAQATFRRAVVSPIEEREPGLRTLRILCDCWLAYSRDRVFAGGCFFFATAAEFDAQPGVIRDALAAADHAWRALLTGQLRAARARGELREESDLELVSFALYGLLETANAQALLHDDPGRYEVASRAIDRLLRAEAADPALLG
jgi:AcrR family transcriptional regulator